MRGFTRDTSVLAAESAQLRADLATARATIATLEARAKELECSAEVISYEAALDQLEESDKARFALQAKVVMLEKEGADALVVLNLLDDLQAKVERAVAALKDVRYSANHSIREALEELRG